MPSTRTFSLESSALFTAVGTSSKYEESDSKSFANFKVRIALSAFAGPVPEPVLPIVSFNRPLESSIR